MSVLLVIKTIIMFQTHMIRVTNQLSEITISEPVFLNKPLTQKAVIKVREGDEVCTKKICLIHVLLQAIVLIKT